MAEKTLEERKAFALAQIKPYFKDNSLCALNENEKCDYFTHEGKMCVAGKNLLNPSDPRFVGISINRLLQKYGEEILKPEARGILDSYEWQTLQNIHDSLASGAESFNIEQSVNNLGLFTLEEVMN